MVGLSRIKSEVSSTKQRAEIQVFIRRIAKAALENDERFNLKRIRKQIDKSGLTKAKKERLNQLRAGRSKVERNRELSKKRVTRLTGTLSQSVPAN